MNTPSQLFRRFLIGTIAVSSIFIAIVLFTSRSNVPGKRILQPLHGINLTTNETFETQIPFYVDDLGFQSDDIIELSIPIEAHNQMLQPALLIERPLHFV